MAHRVCTPGLGSLLFRVAEGDTGKVSVIIIARVENLVSTLLLVVVAFIFYVYAYIECVIGVVLVEVAVYHVNF